jgi:hypothetical protein
MKILFLAAFVALSVLLCLFKVNLLIYLIPLCILVSYLIGSAYSDLKGNRSNFYFGFFLKMKEIYSDYGTFYINIKSDGTVDLFDKKVLFFTKIDTIENSDYTNYQSLIPNIESSIYNSIGKKKKYKVSIKNKIENIYKWNGSLSKEIDRDKKINEVV